MIVLPKINEVEFADFVAWLYDLNFPRPETAVIEENLSSNLERVWVLGAALGAPGYQNEAILEYQTYCVQYSSSWPDIESISNIYRLTPPGSKLRQFAADPTTEFSSPRSSSPRSPAAALGAQDVQAQ